MRSGQTVRALGFTLAAILVAGGAGVVWIKSAPRRTPAGQPGLARLDTQSYATLRDAFNASMGRTRILLLFSPT